MRSVRNHFWFRLIISNNSNNVIIRTLLAWPFLSVLFCSLMSFFIPRLFPPCSKIAVSCYRLEILLCSPSRKDNFSPIAATEGQQFSLFGLVWFTCWTTVARKTKTKTNKGKKADLVNMPSSEPEVVSACQATWIKVIIAPSPRHEEHLSKEGWTDPEQTKYNKFS